MLPYAKHELRKLLRGKSLALSARQRQLAAELAAVLFLSGPLFDSSQRIACYLAHGGEFDIQPIIEAIWLAGKQCYLPVLAAESQNYLHFVEYAEGDDLQTNRYNILEPLFDKERVCAPAELDVVLLPLAGFDEAGYRLGSGGGFYDRTFAFMQTEPRPEKPFLLGVGFQHQGVDALPHEPWDIQLNGVLTEKILTSFPRRRESP